MTFSLTSEAGKELSKDLNKSVTLVENKSLKIDNGLNKIISRKTSLSSYEITVASVQKYEGSRQSLI